MDDLLQVTTTFANALEAQRLASHLVARRLAACVQISGPVESTYRWQGEVESSQEWVCSIKTSRRLFQQVAQVVDEMHPYACPELIATPIVEASAAYAAWLLAQIASD